MSEPTPLDRESLAALIGDVQPASDGLLLSLAESVRNCREHEHPKWEDLYCERMAPVLRRLLDAEAGYEAGFQKAVEVMRQERLPMSVGLLEAQLELDKADAAEDSTPGWLTSRRARLGDFVQCSASRCSFGEWSSKAEARGWVRRGDGWLCVQCADAADERAEIVARMPATVELSDGTVTLTSWSLTELAPDYYGHSYVQIGGWLPENWEPTVEHGTNHMVSADLPGIPDVAQGVNVTVESKGYGGPDAS